MENRRRSERLKNAGSRSGAKRTQTKRTPKGKTRESVGGVLGLTPRHPKGRNLTVTKAAEAAAAAAAKLDKLEVAERSARKKRTSEKGIYEGVDAGRMSYSPIGRDSIAMYSMTNKTFEHDADEKEDEGDDDITDMPPLDGDDDDGHITPDEKENDNDVSSVIRTPGPVE